MAALIDAIDVKRKMFFELDGTPFHCLDVEVNTPCCRRRARRRSRSAPDKCLSSPERASNKEVCRRLCGSAGAAPSTLLRASRETRSG